MARKDRLQAKLQEDINAMELGVPYDTPHSWEMQNGDVGEAGKFPVGQQPIDFNQVGMIRDKLEEWMTLTMSTKAHLRELLAVVNSSPGLRQFAQPLRDALTALDTAEHGLQPNNLQTAMNGLHRALGGAGLQYIR